MKLNNFSVTQHETYADCPRKWWFGWPGGERGPTAPSRYRGSSMHAAIEHRERTGEVATAPLGPVSLDNEGEPVEDFQEYRYPIGAYATHVRALDERGIIPTHGDQILVEHKFSLDTPSGVPLIGVIDLGEGSGHGARVTDWKSTSDIRYAKTREELLQSIQGGVYAHWAMSDEDLPSVDVRFVFVEVTPRGPQGSGLEWLPKVPKSTKGVHAQPVEVTFERARAYNTWASLWPVQDEMLRLSEVKDFNDVPADTSACDKYGGCPHKEKCGVGRHAKESKAIMGFLDRVSKLKESNGASAPAPKEGPPVEPAAAPQSDPAPTAPGRPRDVPVNYVSVAVGGQVVWVPPDHPLAGAPAPNQVVPSDAPPADAYRSANQAKEKPKAERAPRTRRVVAGTAPTAPTAPTDAEEAYRSSPAGTPVSGEAWAPVPEEKPAAPVSVDMGNAVIRRTELTLYVDVAMTKGAGPAPVALEDWLQPVLEKLSADVQAEKGLPHWRLLPFAEEKAAVAMYVNEAIKERGLPAAILVRSGTEAAMVAYSLLVPHAARIFSRLGG